MARLPVSKTGRGGSNPSAPAMGWKRDLKPGARAPGAGGDGKRHG